MKAFKASIVFFFMFLALSFAYPSKKKPYKPCKQLTLYFHDVVYSGHNGDNATSAVVGARDGGNRTTLTPGLNHFGDLIIFDDPITEDNNFHSPPVGRAQGMYLYDTRNTFTAWLAFSFVLNSTKYGHGSINFVGADPIYVETRDISIVGGTGDYFMHRGIATLRTDAYESAAYFRLKVDLKFYDCW